MKNSPEFILQHFQIPKRYEDMSWDKLTLVTEKEKAWAQQYVLGYPDQNEKESIYLYNPVSGTGKTGYAICLAKDLIQSGKLDTYVLFEPYIMLMDALRQDMNSFIGSEIFSRLVGADFIIFDDIGVERLSPSVAERYYLLLEYMWQEKKSAIFTSKFTINDLLNRAEDSVDNEILESIGSRLVGMCDELQLSNNKDFRDR